MSVLATKQRYGGKVATHRKQPEQNGKHRTTIWNQTNKMGKDSLWRTKWVKAHADEEKDFHELTKEERGNVTADKLAEKQYKNPTNIETPWQDRRNGQPGQISIETGIRKYRQVTGKHPKQY